MARKACGLPGEDPKASRSKLFGWAMRGFSKMGDGSAEPSIATLDPDHAKS
jgi:hypothetical protein